MHDYPAPNKVSLTNFFQFGQHYGLWTLKRQCRGIVSATIYPDIEGGVVISFIQENLTASVAFDNDGSINAVISDKVRFPVVWSVTVLEFNGVLTEFDEFFVTGDSHRLTQKDI